VTWKTFEDSERQIERRSGREAATHLEVVDDQSETLGTLTETDGRDCERRVRRASEYVVQDGNEEGLTILREISLLEPLQRRVRDETKLVSSLEDASPGGLNEDIVRSENVDLVDALRLEFGSSRDAVSTGRGQSEHVFLTAHRPARYSQRRDVVLRVGRSERTGNGDDDNLNPRKTTQL
jgi:hypothetical protein